MKPRHLLAAAAFWLALFEIAGCGTVNSKGPTIVPVVNGIVNCALPSLFQSVDFASLLALGETAIEQKDPVSALVTLALKYGPAEVDCVVAYLHDQAKTQKLAAPSNPLVARREAITAEWLAREKANGVSDIVNYGSVK